MLNVNDGMENNANLRYSYGTHIVKGFGPGVYVTSTIVASEEGIAQYIHCHWQRVHSGTVKGHNVTKTLKQ